jgi:hypothetical protein
MVNGCEYTAIEQESQHDLFSVASQERKNVRPRRLFQHLDISVGIPHYETRDTVCWSGMIIRHPF